MSNDLEGRLERLEQKNAALEVRDRRVIRSGLAAAAVAAVALMMGQAAREKDGDTTKFKAIEVGSIVIVDEAGKPRLELGVDKDGTGLDIRDAKGTVRVTIGIDKDGAGLDIRDENGKKRVTIGEGPGDGRNDGAGTLVFDEKERMRVALGVGKDGGGLIVLDENGKPVAGQGK